MGIKIEINTREHFSIFGIKEKKLTVSNPWFAGTATIKTFALEELLGTKMRALYQRKKGRDLFDLILSFKLFPLLNTEEVVKTFNVYMEKENHRVSRAEFEENLLLKTNDPAFREDIFPLISTNIQEPFNAFEDTKIFIIKFLSHLPGDSWKGTGEIVNN